MENSKPNQKRPGRPKIGKSVSFTLPAHVLAAIYKHRANNFDSRPLAATIRELVEAGCDK